MNSLQLVRNTCTAIWCIGEDSRISQWLQQRKEFIYLPLTMIGEEREWDTKIRRSCLTKRYKAQNCDRDKWKKREKAVFLCFLFGATTLQCNRIDTFLSITLNVQHPKWKFFACQLFSSINKHSTRPYAIKLFVSTENNR